jgi:large subunit ribosomal protein L17
MLIYIYIYILFIFHVLYYIFFLFIGRIRTTLVRAKALRKYVDHMITLAKKGSLHHRRQALAFIYDKDLVASLFEQAPERYKERQGGYCRVIKEELPRRGDSAQLAIIELV